MYCLQCTACLAYSHVSLELGGLHCVKIMRNLEEDENAALYGIFQRLAAPDLLSCSLVRGLNNINNIRGPPQLLAGTWRIIV